MSSLRALTLAALFAAVATPARADATLFLGANTTPESRRVQGFSIGVGLLIVAAEFEYANTPQSGEAVPTAPSLKTGSGNLLLQTPFAIYGLLQLAAFSFARSQYDRFVLPALALLSIVGAAWVCAQLARIRPWVSTGVVVVLAPLVLWSAAIAFERPLPGSENWRPDYRDEMFGWIESHANAATNELAPTNNAAASRPKTEDDQSIAIPSPAQKKAPATAGETGSSTDKQKLDALINKNAPFAPAQKQ